MQLNERQNQILEIVTQAAVEGRECPSNLVLKDAVGVGSIATVSQDLTKLERAGLVRVERFNRARRVMITRLGLSTHLPADICTTPARGHAAKEPVKIRRTDFSRCQWVEGEPKERDFCGKPVKPGSSYCEHHHARCYYKKGNGSYERGARVNYNVGSRPAA